MHPSVSLGFLKCWCARFCESPLGPPCASDCQLLLAPYNSAFSCPRDSQCVNVLHPCERQGGLSGWTKGQMGFLQSSLFSMSQTCVSDRATHPWVAGHGLCRLKHVCLAAQHRPVSVSVIKNHKTPPHHQHHTSTATSWLFENKSSNSLLQNIRGFSFSPMRKPVRSFSDWMPQYQQDDVYLCLSKNDPYGYFAKTKTKRSATFMGKVWLNLGN